MEEEVEVRPVFHNSGATVVTPLLRQDDDIQVGFDQISFEDCGLYIWPSSFSSHFLDDHDQANYDHDDRRRVAWFLLPACQTLQHRLCPASAGGDHHRRCCHHNPFHYDLIISTVISVPFMCDHSLSR